MLNTLGESVDAVNDTKLLEVPTYINRPMNEGNSRLTIPRRGVLHN